MSAPGSESPTSGASSTHGPASDLSPPAGERMDRRLVLLLAVTCGVAVTNLYVAQPLLDTIASAFDVSSSTAGLLVTASQVGYVLGLAFLVPLGDLLERRRLIVALLVIAAVGQVGSTVAPGLAVLAAALIVVGVATAVAQVVVPLASSLAGEEERGRIVGTVMSGLLVGILLARTLSGLIAEIGGWRLVFAVASGAMLVLAAVLWRFLPDAPPPVATEGPARKRYGALLRSVVTLVGEEPELRRRMWLGSIGMAIFSVLWTSIAFLLSREPFGYGDGVIGLFGLAGLAGALMAPVAGRLADAGHGHRATTGALVALVVSWGLLELGGTSVVLLVAGIIVLDFAVQGLQITNQSTIYALRPDARSRITTAYMVAYFLGGVAGSTASSIVWGAGGWDAVCALGGGISLVGLLSWAWFAWSAGRVRGQAAAEG
nr:MFS transporter [Patulibacter minatonensis]